MNPKKPRELLPDISQDTGYPLEFLTDLIDFFWDYTHKKMTSLDNLHVMVPHFGTFHVKGDAAIDREINKILPYAMAHRKHPAATPTRFMRGKHASDAVDKLSILKDKYLKDREKRLDIKEKRKAIRDEQVKKDLEGQG